MDSGGLCLEAWKLEMFEMSFGYVLFFFPVIIHFAAFDAFKVIGKTEEMASSNFRLLDVYKPFALVT